MLGSSTIERRYANNALLRTFVRLRNWCGTLAGLCALLMVLTIVPDVLGRFLFRRPIPGTLELNEALMVGVLWLSVAWAQSRGAHVRVELVVRHFPPGVRKVAGIFVLCLALLVFAAGLAGAAREAFISFGLREATIGMIRFPIWPGRFVLAFGLLIFCLQLILDIAGQLIRLLTGEEDGEPATEITSL